MLPIVRLTEGAPSLAPGAPVIRAADYLALVDARALCEAARQEAAGILAEARRQADAIVAEADQHREGEKARGYAEGRAEAEAEAADRRITLAVGTADYIESLEESVVELVISGVRKILGSFDDRALAVRVVSGALAVMRNQKQVTLRVSPDNAESLREQLDTLLSSHPGIGMIEVVADPRLKPGDCVLESDLGIVDAGLHTQLDRLEAALSKHLGDGRTGTMKRSVRDRGP